ncbi:hypothetical protein [Nostoc edaphicum]|nr:hypothetical protein [Nostoc edaphicum]
MIRAELPFPRLVVQTLALATPTAGIALAQRQVHLVNVYGDLR